MNDFFTSFYVPEKYHFGMDDTVLDVDESVRFITFFLKYSHHLSIFLSLLFAKNLNLHTQDKTWVAKFRRWPYDKLVMYFHEAVALIINF